MGSDSENKRDRSRERYKRDRERSKHGEEKRRRFAPEVSEEPRSRRVKEEPTSDDDRDRRRHRHEGRDHREGRDHGRRDDRRKYRKEDEDDSKLKFGRQAKEEGGEEDQVTEEKKKPDFGLSGKLAEDTNTFKGVVIKYSEPPEARKPKRKWRFYVFKGSESLPFIEIHRQSAYLIGRERKVADIPIDHPSCSKQHAALQYRVVKYTREDGSTGRRVRPYLMDLESANGTFVNNNKIPPRRYVELLEKDMVKFGFSSREYILLHADSAESGDEGEEPPADEQEKK